MLAISPAAWGFCGVFVTQAVILVGMGLQRRTAKATYKAVNGVDEENGEPRLIDQVRDARRRLVVLEAMNEWKVGVLKQVAEQVGLRVPPLPESVEHRERAA